MFTLEAFLNNILLFIQGFIDGILNFFGFGGVV